MSRPVMIRNTILSLSLVIFSDVAIAQTITPAPDSTGTLVEYQGHTYQISGGTTAATNLFHSFHSFGLNPGEIAQFLSQPEITHILARVIGGDASLIHGEIQVTGGNADLYLMNPAGIVFGAGASLNVPGDFVATTGDRLGFSSGGWFTATGEPDYHSLTGTPNQLAFTHGEPAAIINLGDLQTPGHIGLYGGTVINAGKIEGKSITLAAVPGEHRIRLSEPGRLLSLELPTEAVTAGITPMDLPTLLTGTGLAAPTVGTVGGDGLVRGDRIHLAASEPIQLDPQLIYTNSPIVSRYGNAEIPVAYVFLDATVPDFQSLLYGGRAGTTIMGIGPGESGIARITAELAAVEAGSVDELHLVGEGEAGNFWLGSDFIDATTVDQYSDQLQTWGAALRDGADLLLYSCFTALGTVGEALMSTLGDRTGADVAASTNGTGSAALGGDWILERSTGNIEAELAFSPSVLANFNDILATFTVSNGGDAGLGSLREAIASANLLPGADEIRFAPGINLVGLTSTELTITDGLTITGQGTNVTIQGNNTFRIFNITTPVSTTFDFLTITGGNTAANGGGINGNGGVVNLTNSIVQGNVAGVSGGGIANTSGAINLTNSIVENNNATTSGGGIFASIGTVNLNNSILRNNIANAGGGIRAGGAVTVNNSTLSNNQATAGDGGAINNINNLTIANSLLENNTAHLNGGGSIAIATTITNSTIRNNTATTVSGGGIYTLGAALTVTNSLFSNNRAAFDGAGLRAGGTTTLNNSQITGNTAGAFGGGLFSAGAATITESAIANNRGNLGGGFHGGALVTLNRSTIHNNTGNAGAGISTAGAVDLTNSTISSNQALGNAAGIISTGGTITNTTIVNNRTIIGNGGGIFRPAGIFTIRNSIIINQDDGGEAPDLVGNWAGSTIESSILGSTTGPTNLTLGAGTILTTDAGLLPLGDYGGPTPTHALRPTSIALNSGNNAFVAGGLDHRGTNRIHGGTVDRGAYESAGFNLTILGGNNQLTVPNTPFREALTVQLTEAAFSRPLPGLPITFSFPTTGPTALTEALTLFTDPQGIVRLNLRANGLVGRYNGFASLTPEITIPFTLTHAPLNLNSLLHTIDREFVNRSLLDLEEGTTVETLESALTDIFTAHVGGNGRPISLAQAQERLREAEEATGRRTGVIYAFFRPPGEMAILPDQTIRDFDQGFGANRRQLLELALEAGNPTDQLELVLVTSDGMILQRRVPQATRSLLLRQVSEMRRAVNSPQRGNAYRPAAKQLYDWLLAPLEPQLKLHGIQHLAWILDAGLRSLPLAALHDGKGHIIERYSVGLMPSLSLTDLSYRSLEGATVLAMGTETFSEQVNLPAVPVEVEAIARQFWQGETLLNEAFTVANFMARRQGEPFRIVHLATHGEFRPGEADQSYIQFWDQRLGLDELQALGLDDPLVDLLVLSACQTALGDRQAELGFAGLAVAAGVKTALGSLWAVSDAGTLALMSEFYDQLDQVTTKAGALRLAQLAMLRGNIYINGNEMITPTARLTLPPSLSLGHASTVDFTHPYYWSAFTLIGNPW
ncbi:CHAT domain-containing protein [Spirulina sp. CCNP1310]|uniref:CHAT domain-containing protein n=1 Tax=Spirulina sp. CCNP1310 TaxID=3110249 RepID=UPI002B21CFEF|nr:CHAT domain-containing protein [Spirulina sp. CCNP1310]MEA5419626.1 CHAT domain-containing protein [Spirulina sp. CCNP1310]